MKPKKSPSERLYNKSHGKLIRTMRKQRSISQIELAKRLNLSHSAYCRMELGETSITVWMMHRITEELK